MSHRSSFFSWSKLNGGHRTRENERVEKKGKETKSRHGRGKSKGKDQIQSRANWRVVKAWTAWWLLINTLPSRV